MASEPHIVPKTDAAFEQVHRANRNLRIVTSIVLLLVLIMTAFTLYQVNRINQAGQQEITERAARNRELLEGLQQSNHDTQVLICNIVTTAFVREGGQPNPDVVRICGPVLADPDNSEAKEQQQSFLAPGSVEAAPTVTRQPAAGGANSSLAQTNNPPQTGGQPQDTSPPPTQTPAPQPGLVDTLQPTIKATSDTVCSVQTLVLNGCMIKL